MFPDLRTIQKAVTHSWIQLAREGKTNCFGSLQFLDKEKGTKGSSLCTLSRTVVVVVVVDRQPPPQPNLTKPCMASWLKSALVSVQMLYVVLSGKLVSADQGFRMPPQQGITTP